MNQYFILQVRENDTTVEVPTLWGTFAMKLFCDKRNWTLSQLFEFIEKSEFTLSDMVDMVWAAAQYGCRKHGKPTNFGDMEVSEWIDGAGGIAGPVIVGFIKHIITSTITETSEPQNETEKKNTSSDGMTQ